MTPREALEQAIAGHQVHRSATMHGCGPECAPFILDAMPEGWSLAEDDFRFPDEALLQAKERGREQGAQQERERLWGVVRELFDSLRDGYGHDPRFAAVWDAFYPEDDR